MGGVGLGGCWLSHREGEKILARVISGLGKVPLLFPGSLSLEVEEKLKGSVCEGELGFAIGSLTAAVLEKAH